MGRAQWEGASTATLTGCDIFPQQSDGMLAETLRVVRREPLLARKFLRDIFFAFKTMKMNFLTHKFK
jgi:hypothetical protein